MIKEKQTDLWVYDLLKEANIKFDAQGSSILEIDEALRTASKNGKGNVGRPEFVAVVKSDDNDDFVLVIEDKRDVSRHVKYDDDGLLTIDVKSTVDYAVNGAYFYGKHIINNTNYKKVFALGISGDEVHHKITPLFIYEREYCKVLDNVETLIQFNSKNIKKYYLTQVLGQNLDDRSIKEVTDSTKELHEYFRNYSNLTTNEKPLVVSGILLALRENGKALLDSLKSDGKDGLKIWNAIQSNLSSCEPQVKKDIILNQLTFIKDNPMLNQYNESLNASPVKFYTNFIYHRIFEDTVNTKTADDLLGLFYSNFMSYSGGDGQSLGIILTPVHVCKLMTDLIDLKYTDRVLDPCTGTGGFLVTAMHEMLKQTNDEEERLAIKKERLHGIELQPYMYTIATTNMILRGDGKSNLLNNNFFSYKPSELKQKSCNKALCNPPYSQGKKDPQLYEICFIEHLLNSLTEGGKAAVIVPLSTMTGKTKIEQQVKDRIFAKHTLEGVISMNKDTFYGVGTVTCIAVFTANQPHPKNKKCKFINFEDNGYVVKPHVGLVKTNSADDKHQFLLDVWNERVEAPTKFCVKTTVESTDEWLHSFYYFNDELPTEEDFDKTISDYLTFEFSQIMQGRGDLFGK